MSSVFNSVTEIGSDLMATYNVNFAMSSLLFSGNTIGYKFYHSNLQRLTYSRFAFGTLAVQFVIKYLGQFDVSETNWSWIPKSITTFSLAESTKLDILLVKQSFSLLRYQVLCMQCFSS